MYLAGRLLLLSDVQTAADSTDAQICATIQECVGGGGLDECDQSVNESKAVDPPDVTSLQL